MVKVIHSTAELINERNSESSSIAFVPTMGNLHQGHISLLEAALTNYKVIYFSIFVNPKQFAPHEDFNRYPRTLENDIKLISELAQRFSKSKIIVYNPNSPTEVFPTGENKTVSVWGLNNDLEGKIRPGHFDGVATVVHRLFELIKPETAYFGLKDYQQCLVIKQMVKDINLPIQIIGMPIIREESGLALSSRNQYLDVDQKEKSVILFQTLLKLKELIGGQRSRVAIAQEKIKDILEDKNWNYLEIRDSETFSKDISKSKNITILAVYQMGVTRLLDNLQVEVQ